jgi:CBS-domain-containing membrane protein
MFSVYGVKGQLFLGSMEQLRQIGGVRAISRTMAILPVDQDGREARSSSEDDLNEVGPMAVPIDETHRSALAAYGEAQKTGLARQPLRQVASVMSHTVITIVDSSTVLEAWQMLARESIGQAPVVSKAGVLVGLLLRADLLPPDRLPAPDRYAVAWQALMAQSVSDIMTTPVPSVAPEADIRHVAQVLLDRDLPGLPVVDAEGGVTGFVSRSDILRAVVTDPPLDLWG